LVKLEKQFSQCSFKKGQNTDIWITELEDYQLRLEELGSSISDNQLILHVLNKMTNNNHLKLAMMEKRIMNKSNPLTFNENREDLNLRFERFTEKQNEESKSDNNQEFVCFGGQFIGKYQNCGVIGHKTFRTVETTTIFRRIRVMALTVLIVVNQDILRVIVKKLRINRTVTVVQVTTTVKAINFLTPTMSCSQQ
jgi:hypothetical protein